MVMARRWNGCRISAITRQIPGQQCDGVWGVQYGIKARMACMIQEKIRVNMTMGERALQSMLVLQDDAGLTG